MAANARIERMVSEASSSSRSVSRAGLMPRIENILPVRAPSLDGLPAAMPPAMVTTGMTMPTLNSSKTPANSRHMSTETGLAPGAFRKIAKTFFIRRRSLSAVAAVFWKSSRRSLPGAAYMPARGFSSFGAWLSRNRAFERSANLYCRLKSELHPSLRLHPGAEGVLDLRHLGDEVGERDELLAGMAAGHHDVLVGRFLPQHLQHFVERQVIVAEHDVELVQQHHPIGRIGDH